MSKVGRNDPCPCGSGKKYKKCCMKKLQEANSFINEIDSLYARIKSINSQLIERSNNTDYTLATFTDAMDLAITSNALSLIKGFLQDNYYSITNALNMRNIIEHYILILMDDAGDISERQKQLFPEQYKLIEYKSYKANKLIANGTIIDPEQMELNYLEAKNKFLAFGFSEAKFKAFIKTRVPFLCNENFNYNTIIKKYCPTIEEAYIHLSRIIHPSTYYKFRNNTYYTSVALAILGLLKDRYSNYTLSYKLSLPFFQESNLIYGLAQNPTFGQALYDIQRKQWEIILKIADFFEKKTKPDNYVSSFFRELSMIIHDINTDSQLGYCENTKLKFKVISEMFACFNKTYFRDTPEQGQASYLLMDTHEVYKNYEMANKEVPDKLFETAYSHYLSCYPQTAITKESFIKAFKTSNGYLLNEQGKTLSLSKLSTSFFECVFKSNDSNQSTDTLIELYKILYYESQNMSHGCGYLYFANQGAWSEDVNVILFLDESIRYLLSKFCTISAEYEFPNEIENDYLNLFLVSYKEMCSLINTKNQIFKNIPRVGKSF